MALNPDRKPDPIRKGQKCETCRVWESLDDADKDALDIWLESKATDQQISDWLAEDQHYTNKVSVGRHRRRECWGQLHRAQ